MENTRHSSETQAHQVRGFFSGYHKDTDMGPHIIMKPLMQGIVLDISSVEIPPSSVIAMWANIKYAGNPL